MFKCVERGFNSKEEGNVNVDLVTPCITPFLFEALSFPAGTLLSLSALHPSTIVQPIA